MANVIRLKRSSIADDSPQTLEYGELALNYRDAKLYFKDATGFIGYFEGLTSSGISAQAASAGEPTDTDVLTWMNV